MNWYIAKIVFNITAEDTEHTPQFDEQLRLIAAENMEEALVKARVIGLREEDSFLNDNLKRVKWEFVNVSDIVPLQGLEDGVEVYSSIHETNEASAYIHCVHQKAIMLRRNVEAL